MTVLASDDFATIVSADRAEAAAKVAIAGFNFSANQKNGFSTSYPS